MPQGTFLDIGPWIRSGPAAGRGLPMEFPLRAGAHFRPPIRPILHGLKYGGLWTIGPALGARMADDLGPWGDVDAVVGIPMHAARRRERGYDQVRLMAQGLAHRAGLPPPRPWLRRRLNVPSQTGLDVTRRRANVRGSFSARRVVPGTRVLLVDDVVTSGSTISAAAATLVEAGATVVEAVCMARTPGTSTGTGEPGTALARP